MAKSVRDRKRQEPAQILYLSTGSTLRNLALSDHPDRGITTGSIVHIIGDSNAGKTLDALTILAEAANDPQFDDYALIHDDVEHKSRFNLASLFGRKAAERIRAPKYVDGVPEGSDDIRDIELCINKMFKDEQSFIYIIDSWDSVNAKEDAEHYQGKLKAYEKGKEEKGTYGMAKPKEASNMLKQIKTNISKTKSIVIVISQTRDNINPLTSSISPKSYSGGRALHFYAMFQWWIAMSETLNDSKYKDRKIGARTLHKITKNHNTGKERKVPGLYYHGYGIDDIGACVDWLTSEQSGKHWDKRTGGFILAKELNQELRRGDLIAFIEQEGKHKQLKRVVHQVWRDIENSIKVQRRPKYA